MQKLQRSMSRNINNFFVLFMIYNWIAWCKRDVSDFFRWNFFSFKSAWIFACAFQLCRKTFSCIVFWLKCSCSALLCSLCMLQYFVFVFLRNKVQTRQKKYRGMLYYLIEKHMKKFRHFWRKKNFTWKSHLRPSCTKPFNYRSKITFLDLFAMPRLRKYPKFHESLLLMQGNMQP